MMAIIKTLLLQDTLGLRRIIVWSLLLVLGCIDCVLAAPPTSTAITVASVKDTPGGLVDGTLYRFTTGIDDVTLTCTPDGGTVDTTSGYRFNQGQWQKEPTKLLSAMAEATCGEYTCEARETSSATTGTKSPPITLTLLCASAGNQCGSDPKVACNTTTGKEHCECKFGGVYPAAGCNACADDGDCNTDATKPWCDTSAPPNTCKQCKVSGQGADKGCAPDSATPRCVVNTGCTKCNNDNDDKFCKRVNNLKPKCNTGSGADSGKCEADPSASTPVTQGSGGTTSDDGGATDSKGTTAAVPDSKTSSAGTVTSTACLVIASVVVALMN